jgi:hypothetical protein
MVSSDVIAAVSSSRLGSDPTSSSRVPIAARRVSSAPSSSAAGMVMTIVGISLQSPRRPGNGATHLLTSTGNATFMTPK